MENPGFPKEGRLVVLCLFSLVEMLTSFVLVWWRVGTWYLRGPYKPQEKSLDIGDFFSPTLLKDPVWAQLSGNWFGRPVVKFNWGKHFDWGSCYIKPRRTSLADKSIGKQAWSYCSPCRNFTSRLFLKEMRDGYYWEGNISVVLSFINCGSIQGVCWTRAMYLKVSLKLFLPCKCLIPFHILFLKLLKAFPLFRFASVSFDNSQHLFFFLFFLTRARHLFSWCPYFHKYSKCKSSRSSDCLV